MSGRRKGAREDEKMGRKWKKTSYKRQLKESHSESKENWPQPPGEMAAKREKRVNISEKEECNYKHNNWIQWYKTVFLCYIRHLKEIRHFLYIVLRSFKCSKKLKSDQNKFHTLRSIQMLEARKEAFSNKVLTKCIILDRKWHCFRNKIFRKLFYQNS